MIVLDASFHGRFEHDSAGLVWTSGQQGRDENKIIDGRSMEARLVKKLSHAAQQIALQEYIEAVTVATERLARLTKAVEAALPGWRCEKVVRALMSLRGVAVINAMTLVAEAGDLTRFDSPTQLMSYFGLTPSEPAGL